MADIVTAAVLLKLCFERGSGSVGVGGEWSDGSGLNEDGSCTFLSISESQ